MRLLPLLLHARQRRLAKLTGKRSGRRRSRRKPNPMDKLTDDLLLEIFARAPYKSARRFPCVCKRWRGLIADPDNRRKLPQTLAGVFYGAGCRSFADVSGTGLPFVDPSLAFLPAREREGLELVDGCNGLLLGRCFRFEDSTEFDYLVINPATGKWVAVPVTRRLSNKEQMVRLGFEPAVSSHFHVFEFQLDWAEDSEIEDADDYGDGDVLGVKIYSSETRLWSCKQSDWYADTKLIPDLNSVFVHGMLYVTTTACLIGAVDVEGRSWTIIDFPCMEDLAFFETGAGFIDLSQGRLRLANNGDVSGEELAIWVLEDISSEEWTLKHTVSFRHLAGMKHAQLGFHEFIVVAIHPDRNMVFFVFGRDKRLMSYDMDSGEVHMISKLEQNYYEHYIPYVPFFSESLADVQQ